MKYIVKKYVNVFELETTDPYAVMATKDLHSDKVDIKYNIFNLPLFLDLIDLTTKQIVLIGENYLITSLLQTN